MLNLTEETPLKDVSPPSTPTTQAGQEASTTPTNSGSATPRKRKTASTTPEKQGDAAPEMPPLPEPAADASAPVKVEDAARAAKRSSAVRAPPAAVTTAGRPPSVASSTRTSTTARHNKRGSVDRFSLRSFLGNSSSGSVHKPSTSPPAGSPVKPTQRAQATVPEETPERRRSTRRQKAMSMQPFSSSPTKQRQPDANPVPKPQDERRRTRSSVNGSMVPAPVKSTRRQSTAAMPPPPVPAPTRPAGMQNRPPSSVTSEMSWASRPSDVTASPSGKAKKVMDWFRKRSSRAPPPPQPFRPDFSTNTAGDLTPRTAPSLVMTPPQPAASAESEESAAHTASDDHAGIVGGERSVPSSRSASGAQSHLSHVTSTSSAATTISTEELPVVREPLAPAKQQQQQQQQQPAPQKQAGKTAPKGKLPPFDASKLNLHQGALDTSAVTSRYPPHVMSDLRVLLWNMGIDIVGLDGDFKLKCVRLSRKKAIAQQQQHASIVGLGLSTNERRASVAMPTSASLASIASATGPAANTFRSLFSSSTSSSALSSSMTSSSTRARQNSLHASSTPATSPAFSLDGFDSYSSPSSSPMLSRPSEGAVVRPRFGSSD